MLLTSVAPVTAWNNPSKCGCVPPRPRVGARDHLPMLPAIALALLPKCPLCLAAWFGILGSLGAESWLRVVWGTPLAIGLLSFALATLALGGRRTHNARPLLLGMLGAAALLGGKCLIDQPLLLYTGLALLAGASFWNARAETH